MMNGFSFPFVQSFNPRISCNFNKTQSEKNVAQIVFLITRCVIAVNKMNERVCKWPTVLVNESLNEKKNISCFCFDLKKSHRPKCRIHTVIFKIIRQNKSFLIKNDCLQINIQHFFI